MPEKPNLVEMPLAAMRTDRGAVPYCILWGVEPEIAEKLAESIAQRISIAPIAKGGLYRPAVEELFTKMMRHLRENHVSMVQIQTTSDVFAAIFRLFNADPMDAVVRDPFKVMDPAGAPQTFLVGEKRPVEVPQGMSASYEDEAATA